MQWQLAESPPADRLVQIYFQCSKWWEPPSRSAHGVRAAETDGGDESVFWESPQLGEED